MGVGMTPDPDKFRKIARVCAALSRSAATAVERDKFAELSKTWLAMADAIDPGIEILDEIPNNEAKSTKQK
jgi:hypothetical protein